METFFFFLAIRKLMLYNSYHGKVHEVSTWSLAPKYKGGDLYCNLAVNFKIKPTGQKRNFVDNSGIKNPWTESQWFTVPWLELKITEPPFPGAPSTTTFAIPTILVGASLRQHPPTFHQDFKKAKRINIERSVWVMTWSLSLISRILW